MPRAAGTYDVRIAAIPIPGVTDANCDLGRAGGSVGSNIGNVTFRTAKRPTITVNGVVVAGFNYASYEGEGYPVSYKGPGVGDYGIELINTAISLTGVPGGSFEGQTPARFTYIFVGDLVPGLL